MKAKAIGRFGSGLSVFRPSIDLAFPSSCLRMESRKMAGLSDFQSDYPLVFILVDPGNPGGGPECFYVSVSEPGNWDVAIAEAMVRAY